MIFNKRFLIAICVALITQASIWSMAPSSNAATVVASKIKNFSPYQGFTESNVTPTSFQATVNPQVIAQIAQAPNLGSSMPQPIKTSGMFEAAQGLTQEELEMLKLSDEQIQEEILEDEALEKLLADQEVDMVIQEALNEIERSRPDQLVRGSTGQTGAFRSTRTNLFQHSAPLLNKKDRGLGWSQRKTLEKFGEIVKDVETQKKLQERYGIKVPSIYKIPKGDFGLYNGFSLFKDPIIMYNPAESNKWIKAAEFAFLHEIGHSYRHTYLVINNLLSYGLHFGFILGILFKVLSIKYGLIGFFIAPRLFKLLTLKFIEEPFADDFAIEQALKMPNGKNILRNAQAEFFRRIEDNRRFPKIITMFYALDPSPSNTSRFLKIENAMKGNPNYRKYTRMAILCAVVEEVTRFIYNYSKDKASMMQGLEEIQKINENFKQKCDELQIQQEGRPMYKYALELAQKYLIDNITNKSAKQSV